MRPHEDARRALPHSRPCRALLPDAAGVDLEVRPFKMGITNKTPWFLEMNPAGKVSFGRIFWLLLIESVQPNPLPKMRA